MNEPQIESPNSAQKLDSGDPVFYVIFFNEMKEHVAEMMIDNFAHFAIEKLIAVANQEQCATLCRRLTPNFAAVACQKHGVITNTIRCLPLLP